MRHLPLLAACSLLLPVAAAHGLQNVSSGAASGQSSNQTGAIEGTIVNAQTGEPIAHALAIVMPRTGVGGERPEARQAATDLSGHFSIGDLAPGRYRLRAEAKHFAPEPGRWRPARALVLDAGKHVGDLVFRLEPCGAISGTITDESGKPVADAAIRALSMLALYGAGEAQANRRGQYRLVDLAPGQYFVQVTVSTDESQKSKKGETYAPTYYPGTNDAGAAIPVAVNASTETDHIDLDLRPVHAVRVTGQVLNGATNQPVPNAWVMLVPREADAASRTGALAALTASRYGVNVRDAQGHFEIDDVPPASYWAYGTMEDKGGSTGRVPVEVGDADVQGVRLVVGANVELSGQIRVEPDIAFDFSKISVLLIPNEPLISTHEGQPGAAGNFVIHAVEPGAYRLSVGVTPGYYLKSARLGGGDVLDTELTLDDAASTASLDILLASTGGSLNGVVMNDDTPAQATVCLVPDAARRNRRDLYLRAPTRADGTFSLAGIAPGDYRLFAFENLNLRTLFNPTLLQAYEAKGESVHFDEGHSESVRLQVIPSEDQP